MLRALWLRMRLCPLITMNIVVERLLAASLAVLILLASHELGRARPVRPTHDPRLYCVLRLVIRLQ